MKPLYLAHYVSNCVVLGPNRRIVVYFQGCGKACEGCIAPEFQPFTKENEYDPIALAKELNVLARDKDITRITISGGDPLEQDSDSIKAFLEALDFDDVLLYTGFTYQELKDRNLLDMLFENVDVLKCGRFIKELNRNHPLIGSSNQTIHYLNPSLAKEYIKYIDNGSRKIQLFNDKDEVYFVGLPPMYIY